MTEAQKEYIITEDELVEVFAFLENPPMYDVPEFTLEIEQRVRSRPAKESSDKVLEELRGHFAKLYDDGFKDPLVTFDAAVSMMKYGDTKLRTKERERLREC